MLRMGGRKSLDADSDGDCIGVEIGVVSFGEEMVNMAVPWAMPVGMPVGITVFVGDGDGL